MERTEINAAFDSRAMEALRSALRHGPQQRAGPKWRQLSDALCEAIAVGRFKPGDRLPTETALAPALDLSVGTVRKALDAVTAAGLIVRHRKTGSFVTDRSAKASEVFVYRFTDPKTGAIALPFVRTLAVEMDQSDGPWAHFLGSAGLVRVDRLVWFEDEPPALSAVYFRPVHGKALLGQPVSEVGHTSMHRMLIERFGLPTLRMAHTVACAPLPDFACHQLSLAARTIGTLWDIRDYTLADQPLVYQRYHLPPGHRPIELNETVGPALSGAAGQGNLTNIATHHGRDEKT